MTLQRRTEQSDVIVTGTIMRIASTFRGSGAGGGRRNGSSSSGYLKVWQVMKGAIDDVRDENSARKRRQIARQHRKRAVRTSDGGSSLLGVAYADARGLDLPLVEVHGLRNGHLCGSYVNEGDTRVFFLRKMTDHRDPADVRRRRRGAVVRKRKSPRRRKNRGSKKRSKKQRRRRKRVKNGDLSSLDVGADDQTKKPSAPEATASLGAEWMRLAAGNGATSAAQNSIGRKPDVESPPTSSILLMISEPARITTTTLTGVEGFISRPVK